MTDPQNGGVGNASSYPLRRERAPTITIDTSAVNSNSPEPHQQDFPQPQPPAYRISTENSDLEPQTSSNNPFTPDLQPAPAFDSRESRPTSPHNVSSPTAKWTDSQTHHYLSVPGARSRVNSLDSDEAANSPNSSFGGDTCVPSSAPGLERPAVQHNHHIIGDPEALQPDPGDEADFEVEDNKFAFTPGHLNKLLHPKSLAAFYALGGLVGIEKGLRSNRHTGLSVDEADLDGTVGFEEATAPGEAPSKPPAPRGTTSSLDGKSGKEDSYSDRKGVFGDNRLPAKKAKSIWELAWIAYNDKVLILLTVAAVVSLALGLYQSLTAESDEPKVQWVEGVAIVVAILIVVIVGAANDWQKERQFVKLNKKKEDRFVKVIRSGKTREISVYDILAGDVMHLEPGDMVPVDGIFIEGHNVKCDESSATGESDLLRKQPGDDVIKAIDNNENISKLDPFIISGAKVAEGVGTFMVTSTGVNSCHGKILMSLQDEGQTTPLQSKLNVLAEYIAKLGLAAGLLLFVVLFIKFLAELANIPGGAEGKGQAFLQIFIVAVTIVVVAVPEGLPLAVTLALAFATTRMLKDNNLVRLLRACETMGNATTICSDKTGTLTQNKMTVVAGTFGTASRFGDKKSSQSQNSSGPLQGAGDNGDVTPTEFVSTLSEPVKELLLSSIVLNSTAFEGEEDGVPAFIGSKTETALLTFARDYLGMPSVNEERANAEIAQLVPFDSSRKCMAVVIKMANGKFRMFVKGASEILISKCTEIVRDPTTGLSESAITDETRDTLDHVVTAYASRSLRTIGLVYKDFEQWPPKGAQTQEDNRQQADFDFVFKGMVFLGVVGIQDPLRPGVAEAVHTCQKAGVFVRMVTGDNLITAKAIAQECGIFTSGGIAMEGPKFRKLSSKQMNQLIPRLQVLARSSPDDKKILVSQLKKLGETVAVTGDGTNDAPALKAADVGFSMGIAGTEVAKEASAIILMDDNFTSIVKAVSWGRTVNDAVKKFLQFQITVNITAVFLTFISGVSSGNGEAVLNAVQLLWVNLIMDTLAALALATDPPTASILDRRPEPKSAPLITLTMWKMIIGQSIYQLVVTLILNFAGRRILSYDTGLEQKQMKTLIFNTFVFMQIFNQYNSRRLDNKFNIFEGIHRNRWFIGIQFVIVAGQVMIIFVGSTAFDVERLNGAQWGYSVVLGALSMPVAVIIRLIPDEFIRKLIPQSWGRQNNNGPQLIVSDEDRRYEWNPALEEIRDQLGFLKTVRGGRLKNLKYKLQHPETLLPRSRSGSRSRDNSIPHTPVGENANYDLLGSPSPATPESRPRQGRSRSNSTFGPAAAMAGVIAGSVAGWTPVDKSGQEDSGASFSWTMPQSGLREQQGIEVHPDTKPDDPIISEPPTSSLIPPSQNPDLAPVFEHAPPPSLPPSRGGLSTSRHSSTSQSRG